MLMRLKNSYPCNPAFGPGSWFTMGEVKQRGTTAALVWTKSSDWQTDRVTLCLLFKGIFKTGEYSCNLAVLTMMASSTNYRGQGLIFPS